MKWKKLGKIFDPTDHRLANNCREFSQSPQALVFDDFVRIYFSTRQSDSEGMYLSHIAYVDMDKNLQNILHVSDHTVLPLGGTGCFDEHGIFPLSPVKTSERIFGYTTGSHRKVSVPADGAIGYVESDDGGRTFHRIGLGPVLASSLNEPFLVADAYVSVFNDVFHMWYIFGTRWIQPPDGTQPQRVYKIAHATSSDGIEWEKEGRFIIDDRLDTDECQALPTVMFHDGLYHMYFCYRHAIGFREDKNRSYRIGYAYSTDLENWMRDDAKAGIDVSERGWDSDMMCYPNVFKCDEKSYMLYNGNKFGRYGFGAAVLESTS